MKKAKTLFGILAMAFGLLASEAFTCSAFGQIFVLSFSSSGTNSVIGEYATSGGTVNASLIQSSIIQSDCSGGLAYDGKGHLFASNPNGLGEYTTAGATVNASLVSSLNYVSSVVVDGGHVFVLYQADLTFLTGPTIGEYTTSGTPINASLISGVALNSVGLKGDGNGHLFVLTGPQIAEYTTSGTLINASLITFPTDCTAFAVDGNEYLYVANGNTNTISKYTTSGVLVNASLISGLPANFYVVDMTLDGNGNLLVLISDLNGSSGTYVAEYTTSGQLVNSSLISGLEGCPTSIIVVTALQPEPYLNLAINLTISRQNTNNDNGGVTTTASPKLSTYATKDILNVLAFDENLAGNWPSNGFPISAKLAIAGDSFIVVNGTNVLLNVSDIMSFRRGETEIISGAQNDVTGLASHTARTRQIAKITFDDTFIVGGKNLKFYLQGLLTQSRIDTTPVASIYSEIRTARITNAAGEGLSQNVPFVCTGTVTATGRSALSL